MSVRILALLMALGAFMACRPTPRRPASVPEAAAWAGHDKGDWVLCEHVPQDPNLLSCTLYNDVKGQKMSTGLFYWEGATPADAGRLPKYRFYDGQAIEVEGGRLVPVGKHVFFASDTESYEKTYPDYGTGKQQARP